MEFGQINEYYNHLKICEKINEMKNLSRTMRAISDCHIWQKYDNRLDEIVSRRAQALINDQFMYDDHQMIIQKFMRDINRRY